MNYFALNTIHDRKCNVELDFFSSLRNITRRKISSLTEMIK